MNAVPWRFFTAYRDQFGLHGVSDRALGRLRHVLRAAVGRVQAVLRRRVTLEEAVWLLIAALVLAFFLTLFVGNVGHGGYGRF